MIKLLLGDSADILKTLEDNSVDSVVSDPPAGIAFMGRSWDSDKGGRDLWIKWLSGIFVEVKRVLKPGGHCLVWALPRTSHWTGVALEDVGFEVRDCVYHVFGCLSEDTEILTINGWEHYHKNICLYPVLCYLCEENRFEFHKPTKKYFYENKYPAYRIQSDHTDQIVSRNHRVLVERSGRKEFVFAETLEQQENIPFLESLSDLPETLSNIHEGKSITKQDLFYRMQRHTNIQSKKRSFSWKNSTLDKRTLCTLWKNSGNEEETTQVQQKGILQLFLSCKRTLQTLTSFLFKWQREEKSQKGHEIREKSCMERWCNIFQNTWELCWGKICQMSNRVFIYGTKRWVCYGTPSYCSHAASTSFTSDGNSSSHRSQPNEQRSFKSDVIQNKSGTQTVRGTTATVTEIEYKGNVWCVEVPTGAFVARRNGKIFITGNSGFPKSMNIGKAVDAIGGQSLSWFIDYILEVADEKGISRKELTMLFPSKNGNPTGWLWNKQKTQGITIDQFNKIKTFLNLPFENIEETKREVIGKGKAGLTAGSIANFAGEKEFDLTKGTSVFEGWGTALKPAVECWWLVRKPISENTIAENVLKHGTGGLNIEMCRIPLQETGEDSRLGGKGTWSTENAGWVVSGSKRERVSSSEKGRFPSNLIHDGSEEVLSYFPNAGGQQGDLTNHTRVIKSPNGICGTQTPRFDAIAREENDKSAARFFYCSKPSPSERQFGCGEIEEKFDSPRPWCTEESDRGRIATRMVSRTGKNNHPTVKSIKLMSYLCKLITPKGGIILDPFMGSGSTGIAAKINSFSFIGIEKEEPYLKIAEARIKAHTVGKVTVPKVKKEKVLKVESSSETVQNTLFEL
jgi:site-specific DNA-methyltransferase (adenine-specific)